MDSMKQSTRTSGILLEGSWDFTTFVWQMSQGNCNASATLPASRGLGKPVMRFLSLHRESHCKLSFGICCLQSSMSAQKGLSRGNEVANFL